MTDSASAKRAMRALMRRSAPVDAGIPLCRAIEALPLPPALPVAGVWPLPGEPDLRPAWHVLHGRGHPVSLPETTPRGEALRFRSWHPDASMHPGRFGTAHPDGPEAAPALIFVPTLAWDEALHRLGYGGGYYDRTLAARPDAVAVGLGTEDRRVAAVPRGPYDRRLDAVLTERRLLLEEGRTVADLVSGRHRRS